MANASRWSLSARQGFLVVALFTAGLFVMCCGTGMTNIPVAVLGGAVGLLGPIVIVLSSVRANRADVFGSAHVSQSSQPPMTGIYGRADLQLMINGQGIHNAVVRVRDPQVPVSKWPDVGATLPVLIPNGNPRRAQVLWDQVRSHRDDVAFGGGYSRYADDEDYYEYSPTPPAGVDLLDEVPDEEAPGDDLVVDPVPVDDPWRRPADAPVAPEEVAAPDEAPAVADSAAPEEEEEARVPAGVAPVAHAPAATAAPAPPAPPTQAPGGPLPRRRPSPWPRRQAERTDSGPSTSPVPGVNGRGAASAVEGSAVAPAEAPAESASPTEPEVPSPAQAEPPPAAEPEQPSPAQAEPPSAAEPEQPSPAEPPASVEATTEATAEPAAETAAAETVAAGTAAAEPADPTEAPPAEQDSARVGRERPSPRPSVFPAKPTASAVSAAEAAAAMVAEAEAQARAEAQANSATSPEPEPEARPVPEPEPADAAPPQPTTTEASTEPPTEADAKATDTPTATETPDPTATETPDPTATETPDPTATETAAPPPSKPRAIELTITSPALAARTDANRDSGNPVEPSPYVASYLSDEPEDSQPGLGGVHNVSVTLIVANLRRSLTFYRDLLGLTEIDSGVGSAVLASGNARILLRQVADSRPVDRRVVHLNLEVDDVHEAYERLRREGVEFMHPPRVVNQGEQLEQWAATLRDPDGHAIALTRWEVRP